MKKNGGKATEEIFEQSYSQDNFMSGFSIYNSEGNVEYKREVEKMVYELKQELYPVPAAEKTSSAVSSEKKDAKKHARVETDKRKFPLVLILLFNLLAIAVVVIACFDLGKVGSMIAPFYQETPTSLIPVSILDGLFGELSALGIQSKLCYTLQADTVSSIALIVFAAFGTLTTLLGLWQVIAAIVALARKNGKKQIRFGVRAFLMLISLFIVLLSIITLKAELGFGDFCSLIFPKILEEYLPLTWGKTQFGLPRIDENYVLYSGYGLYALILIPLITMILSSCCYKKKK